MKEFAIFCRTLSSSNVNLFLNKLLNKPQQRRWWNWIVDWELLEVETSGLSKTDISRMDVRNELGKTKCLKHFCNTFKNQTVSICEASFPTLPISHGISSVRTVSSRAGQFSGVITSKFISLRDYQVPIKTGSKWGRDGARDGARAAQHQDKWPALRATHINANFGCLDYHTQWNDQSCTTSLIFTECK